MDVAGLARIDALRHRLELVLLAALAAGCGPGDIGPFGDDGIVPRPNTDDGIVIDTGTESTTGDPQICLVEIDAVGVGDCDATLGYRWTTGGCDDVGGCSCEGTDCDLLHQTKIECIEAYLHCDLCDPCPGSCVVHCDGSGYLNDIACGGGCWDGEVSGYSCSTNGLEQPITPDVYCSGFGRVVLTTPQQATIEQAGPAMSSAAHAWAHVHACEHASVQGFERLARQLEALGAPTKLIADAERFAADERRHAASTLAIARRFDPEIEPPEPEATPEPAATPELSALLEDTILAGCIGETLSALELEHMRAACRDESLASVLAEIADDEVRHAEHAWLLLAYLLRRFPALRDPAMQLLRRPCCTVPLGLNHDLPAFGLLADGTRAELWDAGRRRVVDRLAACVLALEPEAVVSDPLSPGPILC